MREEETIFFDQLAANGNSLYVAATEKGLVFVGSLEGEFSELHAWTERNFPRLELQQDGERLDKYRRQLADYFQGKLREFDLPIIMTGTDFRRQVWQELKKIPYGETKTYTEIAEGIGRPEAVRAVASAIGANPLLVVLPCHRVIGKSGKLTGYRGGMRMKENLLTLERTAAG